MILFLSQNFNRLKLPDRTNRTARPGSKQTEATPARERRSGGYAGKRRGRTTINTFAAFEF